MPYILALDQGTTSSRAILFDRQGRVDAVAQQEFEQIFPEPGWVEHDALDIWNTQCQVMDDVVSQRGLSSSEIVAIGITNQRETTVIWDRKTGKPIYHAIVWQDRRTASQCDRLKDAGYAGLISSRTGLVLDAYFSGPKIQWILNHVDGARERAESGELAFGTIDSWIVWNLTGGEIHVTDVSNASRTMIYNIHTGNWDDELLELMAIPRCILPEVCASSRIYGHTSSGGRLAGIPIAGIAGDQQSALFGQMCTGKGMVKATYGTGCFMLMNTGGKAIKSKNNLLTTVAWKIDDRTEYALEGSIFAAGAVVQWLRDGIGLFESAEEIETLAKSVPDNGGIYFVPAFVGLGAPHWDQYARGLIAGITRGTTKGHLARAALEGIAYQVADVLEAMRSDSDIRMNELRVDGGASSNDLLMQFQADILGVPVVRPCVLETTALGAAYLAGLAVGFWKNRDEIADQWKIDQVFIPGKSVEEIGALKNGWRKSLKRSKGWIDRD